ncbi:MAG: hypothetical protein K2L87_03305, partial [Clostridiales bacterium]|nr:hypothetical protein [Clostridiales bacterium]
YGTLNATKRSASAAVQITTVDEMQGDHNELRNKIHVDFSVPSEAEDEIDLADSEQKDWYTASNHQIGRLSGSGLYLMSQKGIQYDYVDASNKPRITRFYTSLSNHSRGYAKVTLTIDKLKAGDIVDLQCFFRDAGAGYTQVGWCDFTSAYNALERGENQKITVWADLSTVSSVDRMVFFTTASNRQVSYLLRGVDIEWGSSVVSSAEGKLINARNTENIVFEKMVTKAESGSNYDGYAIHGYSSEYGSGLNSGRWGPDIRVMNDENGEYFRYITGADDGWWMLTKGKYGTEGVQTADVSVTVQKKYAGNVGMFRLRFLPKGGEGNGQDVYVDFDNDNQLDSPIDVMEAGEWVTLTMRDVDLTPIKSYDSIHLYVRAVANSEPVEGQEVYLRNIFINWGDNNGGSPVREKALTEDENEIDGLAYASTAGVKLQSDWKGDEYTAYDFGAMTENKTNASFRGSNLSAGKYATALTFRKTAELSDSFALSMAAAKSGTEVTSKDLTAKIKEAPVGEWVTVISDEYELADKAANGFTVALQGAAGDTLQVKDYSIVKTAEYVEKGRTFGVASEVVRDFTAIESMGVTEYDFSQNGFPEIGNWSDSFPVIRTNGQKVVYEDGVPAMEIYRRTQEEIDEAKVTYNWPEQADGFYVPRDEGHFFFTAPINAGYATISMTVKTGTNFKGTDNFSLDGYQGSEPWWKIVSFTDDLNAAPKGEWKTYTANVYLTKAIDSVKVCISTRDFDSDLYIRDLIISYASDAASVNYVATDKNEVAFKLITGDTTINSVKTNGEALPTSAYTLENSKFTLKQEYLDTLANGSYDYVLSNGTDSVTLSVFVSGVAPVFTSESFTVKSGAEEDVTLNVNYQNSGVNSVAIGETLLEEGVHYDVNTQEGTLTLYKAAFEGLEAGEKTLTLTTRAGSAELAFTVEGSSSNLGLIIGLSVAGVVVVAGVAVAVVLVLKKKKKGNTQPEQK